MIALERLWKVALNSGIQANGSGVAINVKIS